MHSVLSHHPDKYQEWNHADEYLHFLIEITDYFSPFIKNSEKNIGNDGLEFRGVMLIQRSRYLYC